MRQRRQAEARAGEGGLTGPLNLRRHPSAAPVADPASDPRLEEGRVLFNGGHHWHAHEAWEPLWMGLEGDEKLAIQGFIMAAAMLVQYGKGVGRGVANHWANVALRLEPRSREGVWGLDVADLLRQLAPFAAAAQRGDFALRPRDVQLRRL